MVVSDARLVSRSRAGRLDAPHDAGVHQRRKGVVHRLLGDGADLAARDISHHIGGGMWTGGHGLEHSKALGGHLHAVAAQDLSGNRHDP